MEELEEVPVVDEDVGGGHQDIACGVEIGLGLAHAAVIHLKISVCIKICQDFFHPMPHQRLRPYEHSHEDWLRYPDYALFHHRQESQDDVLLAEDAPDGLEEARSVPAVALERTLLQLLGPFSEGKCMIMD